MKQSIKALTVMLSIILLCGGLLAILSDVLFVSNEERISRAIAKIYKEEPTNLEQTIDVNQVDGSSFEELGFVKSAYALDNGDYLVLATGKKGYSNGTVTTYVALEVNENIVSVKKVVEDSYTGQTLMAKLSSIYERFIGKTSNNSVDEVVEIVGGATYSSSAASNSVYVAMQFVSLVIGG